MGTHPIFESDFDCLTDVAQNKGMAREKPILLGDTEKARCGETSPTSEIGKAAEKAFCTRY